MRMFQTKSFLIVAALASLATPALPQARLVKDIDTGVSSNTGSSFVRAGSVTFFVQCPASVGCELARTDGTTAGTRLVKDIWVGPTPSNPQNLTDFGGVLFFTAVDEVHGRELWKSDGTEAGTVMLKDIIPGPGEGLKAFAEFTMVASGGSLFFPANDGDPHGLELWKTDGTEAGTVMVKDIRPGSSGSSPMNLVTVGSVVYFAATDGANGSELWKSDGSAGGTVLVKDICAGTCSSQISSHPVARFLGAGPYPTVIVNTLFFAANDGSHGFELWKSDGSAGGTEMVKDICVGACSSLGLSQYYMAPLVSLGSTLFFGATSGLWRSDGTEAGTVQVVGSIEGPTDRITVANGRLFFRRVFSANLWTSDGTAAGTIKIGTFDIDGPIWTLPAMSGIVFVVATDGISGYELWKSDGTAGGSGKVTDLCPGSCSGLGGIEGAGAGLLFLSGNDGANTRVGRSDGTEAGTVLFGDTQPASSSLRLPVRVGANVFYVNEGIQTQTAAHLKGLWRTDGTDAGTIMVKAGSFATASPQMAESNGRLFFAFFDSVAGRELWKTDGTPGGTVMIKDICPGACGSDARSIVSMGGFAYFAASDGTTGFELWRSDGTATGTTMVKDIRPGSAASLPEGLVTAGGMIFFTADDGVNGRELWKSDGTASGTVMVKEITPQSGATLISQMSMVRGHLYFVQRLTSGGTTYALWRSDGTDAGTVQVREITGRTPDPLSYNPQLTDVNGTLFFVSEDDANGMELWKSDGTEAGTAMVKNIRPSAGSSSPTDLVSLNGVLFFAADDGSRGFELWKSDGTAAGTVLVKDIAAGLPSSMRATGSTVILGGVPAPLFTVVQDTLYFAANDSVRGVELWRTDGTEAGTVMVQEIGEGTSGDVGTIVRGQQGVFFSQWSNATGVELWLLPIDTQRVFRLYSNRTFEHLYTTDAYEDSILPQYGWTREGRAYTVLSSDAVYQGLIPVAFHRLYNPGSQQHLWTSDSNESSTLAASPHWSYEGVMGYVLTSAISGSMPLYRMALPSPSLHLWTTDAHEYQVLQTRGWIPEGIVGHVLP